MLFTLNATSQALNETCCLEVPACQASHILTSRSIIKSTYRRDGLQKAKQERRQHDVQYYFISRNCHLYTF